MPDEPVVRREELTAAVAARRELPEHEDELVAGFLDQIERGLDRRIDERLAQRKANVPGKPVAGDGAFVITLVSLGVSIPLIAIAGGTAGLAGVVAVCVAVVLVNYFFRS